MSVLSSTRTTGFRVKSGLSVWDSAASLDGVAARPADVDGEVDDAREVRERRDRQHLDDVPVLERVVEDARRVDDLPLRAVEVRVPDVRLFVVNAYGRTSTFAFVRSFISDDLPTFGKPRGSATWTPDRCSGAARGAAGPARSPRATTSAG